MTRRLATLFALLSSFLFAQSPAPATQVLATLSLRNPAMREQITKTMPEEVRATVQLYLDGKIQQWYARGDGRGVIFILNCTTVEEAKAITNTLPLVKEGFAEFEFMPLSPLTPLRFLLGGK